MSFDDEINKGLEYLEKEDYKLASVHFINATRLNPNDYNAWLYLGICLSELEENKAALEAYKRCIDIDDTLPFAHTNIGILYLKKRDAYDAARYLLKAVKLDPNDLPTRLNLGIAYTRMRNKELEALREFKFILQKDSDMAEAWDKLGRLFVEFNRKDLALFCFDMARMLGYKTEKNRKIINDFKFDGIKPKNPFDADVIEEAFNPYKVELTPP